MLPAEPVATSEHNTGIRDALKKLKSAFCICKKMYYGEIKKIDIANGLGVRVSLFVSGCRNKCPGCFNQMTWNFNYGQEFTQKTEEEMMRVRNLGRKSLKEVSMKLHERGLSFKHQYDGDGGVDIFDDTDDADDFYDDDTTDDDDID